MTYTPYTKMYTENLIAGLERTRDELKEIIADVLDHYVDKRDTSSGRKLAGRLHDMVGSITDDLQS